ncbi:MAG: endopeptidase La [Peptostreptococcaceae bacterium]
MEQNNEYKIPLVPLKGITVYPQMIQHFEVGREISINAIEQSIEVDSLIMLSSQKDQLIDFPTEDDIYDVGTICKIVNVKRLPGNIILLFVEGISRGNIKELELVDESYYEAVVEEVPEDDAILDGDLEFEAYLRRLEASYQEYVSNYSKVSDELLTQLDIEGSPSKYIDTVASNLYLKPSSKQEILEAFNLKDRIELIYKIVGEELELLRVDKKIAIKVRKQVAKSQKDYYLREQMRVIQKELGDDDLDDEIENFRLQLKKLKVSKDIKQKIEREIKKLTRLSSHSPDASTSRIYLENIFSLPWNKETKDKIDLENSKEVLDEAHYGMEKVKERILEYLAIRSLSNKLKSPIICLVGPPGVGKTSIAKSIADSLNRKFVRISLGGVTDEAEIRGHRRTYVGAIPGRIINALKEVKIKNPVILLDEIDKMGTDRRANPADAMLEVLDPEQNKDFTDHYLELPFDLSKTLFVTTANSLGTIPRPLLDRMEIIELSGYIEEEKLNIAKKYLLKKQIEDNGLQGDFVKIDDETLREVIRSYTKEAGVRNLERTIGKICRKCAKKYVECNSLEEIVITKENLSEYLGKVKYRYEMIGDKPEVGIVTGLAWTSVGGETLTVEVNTLKGKGQIVLTGKLGEVMKESARTGITYIRSIHDKFNINSDFYKDTDIHIHIPEGAVPKDGPSAGITMALAVLSSLTNIPVRNDIAMTGEITLRGRVLAVGGVKEKLIAAHRAGIKKVLLPVDCEADLDDLPQNVKDDLEFVLVEHMDQVLEHSLVGSGE